MKFHQLKYLCEVARRGLNVTAASERLHTSQSGVSRQIQLLEEELGVEVFVRNGKRLVGVTESGQMILEISKRILHDTESLRMVGREFSTESRGSLTIATTHSQARYTLPRVLPAFAQKYPNVRLRLHQGNPTHVVEMVASGQANLGIATEAIAESKELVSIPCLEWQHVVITPVGHALTRESPLRIDMLSCYPLITYDQGFAGRRRIDGVFQEHGLTSNIVLEAIDADVIKTYVELGMGVGIVAEIAYDPMRDKGIEAIGAGGLFGVHTTRVGIKRGLHPARYVIDFIELLAPRQTRAMIEACLLNQTETAGTAIAATTRAPRTETVPNPVVTQTEGSLP
ncbi:MAG: CysB family HTH-type transcriptional regulator [Magnetococcales bacterium]|nr:CysB family HTH-type transcriptional regulator [Magnetococcales bacterium]